MDNEYAKEMIAFDPERWYNWFWKISRKKNEYFQFKIGPNLTKIFYDEIVSF